METFYLIIVIVLFTLAISDLVVGVSNDAVNFLNSAIGSKAAPFRVIMIIAALGVLFGATFSSGMMEVARKGVFHPDMFSFSEIMIIFLAVMITDVLLLDLFNTFGLPTSTTVSIVFELLGAAVAVTIIKIYGSADTVAEMGAYINTSKALAIMAGILLSVVIAFSVGLIVQFFSRIIFSFNYKRSYKYFGALFGGFAITAIVFFILLKGAKGSSFITPERLDWINSHKMMILLINFAFWTTLLQILVSFFNINILKIIVLVGTFALAMAFAGNDLVNFIGVPLAGYSSYTAWVAAGSPDATGFTMDILKNPVQTPTLYLLIAGLVMVITLWLSRKARSVTATTIDLARQGDGDERFHSSYFARALVRRAMSLYHVSQKNLPASFMQKIERRFEKATSKEDEKGKPAFDLIRASVNLIVASILISIGTALKLPLSTTYVTFMVAMGTSLADGAWGRESAVYRITGVVTVITGWFFTAIIAFSVAFIIAMLISWGGWISITLLLAIAIFFIIKTHALHQKRDTEKKHDDQLNTPKKLHDGTTIFSACNQEVEAFILASAKIYSLLVENFIKENRKELKKLKGEIRDIQEKISALKKNIPNTIQLLREDSIGTGHHYVQVIDYLKESADSLYRLTKPAYDHVDNNHPPMIKTQVKGMQELEKLASHYLSLAHRIVSDKEFTKTDQMIDMKSTIISTIFDYKKKQIKLIKKESVGKKNSMFFLNFLSETGNLANLMHQMIEAEKAFVSYNQNGHPVEEEEEE